MRFSVIVSTKNRARAVIPCLDSIARSIQHAHRSDGEIILVDNGSTDETNSIVRAWQTTVPFKFIFEPQPGIAVAHNRAIEAASGKLLIFTDDDCVMDERYIEQALAYDDKDGDNLVIRGGRISLGNADDLPLTIKTDVKTERFSLAANSTRHHCLSGKISGCNMVMRRALFEKIGWFDTRFGPGSPVISSGNDTEFIYRAYLAHVVMEYVPDMEVIHFHGRKEKTVGFELMKKYTIANGALYLKFALKHPNFCRPFYWDIKNAIKEIVSNNNTYLPVIGFSHKHKIIYTLKGAFLYLQMAVLQPEITLVSGEPRKVYSGGI